MTTQISKVDKEIKRLRRDILKVIDSTRRAAREIWRLCVGIK